MSILDRLLGGESNDDESCCDMQIEEVDSDENEADAPDERADRMED
ncbi:hypothetical protein GLW36_12540 [Halorubrum terrestre]|uniref:Uncharacterized protein n=1 Tax=Halorubrum distributum TaxID=29283 RepID=A0A6B1IE29_9EURY|nr:hypothetical protein [Halorubrum terrestre]MYL17467.1 hypothetical protein [Halorubrum terrestre]